MEKDVTYSTVLIDMDLRKEMDYESLLNAVEDKIHSAGISVNLPLTHTMTKGLYSREVFLPKGAVLTSKVHKEAHQFVLLKGSMVIINEDGAVRINAPFHGVTMPGSTRMGVALEDSIWTTFHKCDLVEDRDYTEEELKELVVKIEDELVEDRRNLNLNNKVTCHS